MMEFRFEEIHPDPLIAREVTIECLLGVVAEARAAITRGLDYNAVTPNGVSIKNTLRNALERTTEQDIESRLYHESVAPVAPSRSAAPPTRIERDQARGIKPPVTWDEASAAPPSEREAAIKAKDFARSQAWFDKMPRPMPNDDVGWWYNFADTLVEHVLQARAAVPQDSVASDCANHPYGCQCATCVNQRFGAAAVPAPGEKNDGKL